MQYKTVTVEHYLLMSRKEVADINTKYSHIINSCAAEGWKLLGIHTLPITRRAGCMKMCFGVFWEKYNMDVLIFFKD